jgi:hypothetical protein
VFTAETKGGEVVVLPAFNNRSFARVNSSSVKAPRARSSSNLLRSSLRVTAISFVGGVIGGSAVLGLSILTRRFVFHLLTMMLNHTSRSGSHDGVMSGDMADHTADCRPLQTSFGKSRGG